MTSNPMDCWACCGNPMNGHHALGCLYAPTPPGGGDGVDQPTNGGTMSRTILIALAALIVACGANTSPGDGEKIGQIVRVARVGMIYQTWEGQLIRGGMTDGSGTVGVAPFEFNVESDSLAALVSEAMQNQTEVIIRYHAEGICSISRDETGECYFLTGIRPKTP